ncbi:MAG: hypothetical protein HY824_03365 [Acidobacteria bacterium]|nr:hypothetical protein [Acidobacteriota bacterium]
MTRLVAIVVAAASLFGPSASAQSTETLNLRGHAQTLHIYGRRGDPPVVISSGDGGWMHLAPHVAQVLASRGCFVVGFDVKGYLRGFTAGGAGLRPDDEPGDYKTLVDFAARGSSRRPILIGVSEGAGLSVMAAGQADVKAAIDGVVGLGLPDVNELGWRWTDALIYLTHGVPHEPTFRTTVFIGSVAPLPLAMIHSSHDEFVPLAEARQVFAAAREPKHLWVVNAFNHRFSSNLAEFDRRLVEALAWIVDRADGC